MKFLIFLALLSTVLLWGVSVTAQITNITTHQSYPTIQAALDEVECGQIITLHSGTYVEPGLYFGAKDNVTIRASSGQPDVTITGSGSGCFAAFNCYGLTIENIMFKNGDAATNTGAPSYGRGGGVYYYGCQGAVLDHCEISLNDAQTGGGIYAVNSDVSLIDCVCSHNNAEADGGGMYFENSTVFAVRLTFDYNHADGNGGGLMCTSGSYFAGQYPSPGGFIRGNAADVNGGAIYVGDDSTVEIADVPFMVGSSALLGPQGYIETGAGAAYLQDHSFYIEGRWAGDHVPVVLLENQLPRLRATSAAGSELVSILLMPDRTGNSFGKAYLWGNQGIVNATIKVYGMDPNRPNTDAWLTMTGNVFTPWGTHADAPVDEFGRTEFNLPIQGGGHSAPPWTGVVVQTIFNGASEPLPIAFNSPDITGNGLVDLADYVLMVQDYGSTGFDSYRSDFNFDQVVNMADIALFASSYCSFWAPEVPDGEVSSGLNCD